MLTFCQKIPYVTCRIPDGTQAGPGYMAFKRARMARMLQCTIVLNGLGGDPPVPVTQSTCQNRMVLYCAILGYQGTARMAYLPRAMWMAGSKETEAH